MKYLAVSILSIILSASSYADEIETAMLKAAQQCSDAGISKDWDATVSFMPPPMVEAMGGKESVIDAAKMADQKMTGDNFVITKAVVEKPIQRKEVDTKIYAIVPQIMTIKVPQGTLRHKGYMLAIAEKPALTWHFVSLTKANEAPLKQMFPELAGGFEFPVHEKPVLERK